MLLYVVVAVVVVAVAAVAVVAVDDVVKTAAHALPIAGLCMKCC